MGGHLSDMPANPIRRIAIVRALHLGDLLLAVPAWRLLRRVFPGAETTLIGLPWAKELVARYPYIDRLVEFPGFPGMLEVELDGGKLAEFLEGSRGYGYDLAIQMHGSGEASAKFTASLGAMCTIGYEPLHGQRYLDYSLPYPNDKMEIHRNLRLVEFFTGEIGDPTLEFPVLPEDERALQGIRLWTEIAPGTRLVGIHPGARPPARRWMPERFAALGDKLAKEHRAKVVLTGGPGEENLCAKIAAKMTSNPVNIAGQTPLGVLAAIMTHLILFVSNDSGPAHVAVAVDTPSITIFGPADPERWAPLDRTRHRIVYKKVECNPCPYWECPIDHRCLTRVTVDDVSRVADELLQEAKAA